MRKLWSLLKVQLLTTLGINKELFSKDENGKQRLIFSGILLCIIGIIIIGISTFYSIMLAFVLSKFQKMELLIAIMMASASIVILFTTIYKTKGMLFGFKDYDTIMSLPVKVKTIVNSRMIMLYLMNIFLTIAVMGPAGLVYGITMYMSISFYIIYIVMMFFIPFVPIVIATIIGTLISMVASKFKHKNLFETTITFGVLIIIVILSMNAKGIEGDFENIGVLVGDIIYKTYPLSKMFVTALCYNDIYSLLLFISISLLIFLVFVSIIAKKYKYINTVFTTIKTHSNYKLSKYKKYSQFESLYYKEVKRYFSSTLYIVNTSFGLIMLLLLVGAIVILNPVELGEILKIPGFSENINSFLPIVISIFVAMTCTTACSISLEGNNLWILKSSPISVRNIFLSKVAVNLTITVPTILFSSTSLGIYLKPTVLQWILFYITPITYACFISIMGILINLFFPKMEWVNEVVVIKQSMATFLAMLIGIISVSVPFVSIIKFNWIPKELLLIIITCIIFMATVFICILLDKKGKSLFLRLSK